MTNTTEKSFELFIDPEEDEVFFGSISEKEAVVKAKLQTRKSLEYDHDTKDREAQADRLNVMKRLSAVNESGPNDCSPEREKSLLKNISGIGDDASSSYSSNFLLGQNSKCLEVDISDVNQLTDDLNIKVTLNGELTLSTSLEAGGDTARGDVVKGCSVITDQNHKKYLTGHTFENKIQKEHAYNIRVNQTDIILDHNYHTPVKCEIDKSILTTPKSVVKADKDGGFLKVLSEIALVKAQQEEDTFKQVIEADVNENVTPGKPQIPEIRITAATPDYPIKSPAPVRIKMNVGKFHFDYNKSECAESVAPAVEVPDSPVTVCAALHRENMPEKQLHTDENQQTQFGESITNNSVTLKSHMLLTDSPLSHRIFENVEALCFNSHSVLEEQATGNKCNRTDVDPVEICLSGNADHILFAHDTETAKPAILSKTEVVRNGNIYYEPTRTFPFAKLDGEINVKQRTSLPSSWDEIRKPIDMTDIEIVASPTSTCTYTTKTNHLFEHLQFQKSQADSSIGNDASYQNTNFFNETIEEFIREEEEENEMKCFSKSIKSCLCECDNRTENLNQNEVDIEKEIGGKKGRIELKVNDEVIDRVVLHPKNNFFAASETIVEANLKQNRDLLKNEKPLVASKSDNVSETQRIALNRTSNGLIENEGKGKVLEMSRDEIVGVKDSIIQEDAARLVCSFQSHMADDSLNFSLLELDKSDSFINADTSNSFNDSPLQPSTALSDQQTELLKEILRNNPKTPLLPMPFTKSMSQSNIIGDAGEKGHLKSTPKNAARAAPSRTDVTGSVGKVGDVEEDESSKKISVKPSSTSKITNQKKVSSVKRATTVNTKENATEEKHARGFRSVEKNLRPPTVISRIPKFGTASKIPTCEKLLAKVGLRTPPLKVATNNAQKALHFSNIESPVNAYINNKPTPLLLNIKPEVKKESAKRVWIKRAGDSCKENISDVNTCTRVPLPFVDYKSGTPLKLEKPVESRLPRLAPTMKKLITGHSPTVQKHEGRIRLTAPKRRQLGIKESSIPDVNEVSVVVSHVACKSNTIN